MKLTRTVSSPTRFPDWMFLTLSSKNSWNMKNCGSVFLIWRNEKKRGVSWCKGNLTVLWGLILAILRAFSMADSDGLQTIGVFGNEVKVGLGWAKCAMMSNISCFVGLVVEDFCEPCKNSISSSSSEAVFLWMGLRVSKHMIPSKQPSNPSLLRTLVAWILSAFVKICRFHPFKNERKNKPFLDKALLVKEKKKKRHDLPLFWKASLAEDFSKQDQASDFHKVVSHGQSCKYIKLISMLPKNEEEEEGKEQIDDYHISYLWYSS